jgi:hypothetical protein
MLGCYRDDLCSTFGFVPPPAVNLIRLSLRFRVGGNATALAALQQEEVKQALLPSQKSKPAA